MLVINDSDAATQAELSASPGSEDMVLVHVGRGVGCGIVTGGRRVTGAHHAAGEIGHVTVGTDGGEDCPCGKRGCLETWLSVPRLRAALDSPDGSEVVEAGGERLGVALRGRPALPPRKDNRKAFLRITFPLLAPGLVAYAVYAFLQAWNEFTVAFIMTEEQSRTLPLWLRGFVQASASRETDWGQVMAASTLVAVPVIIFFLIVQGRMSSGLVGGAVKG